MLLLVLPGREPKGVGGGGLEAYLIARNVDRETAFRSNSGPLSLGPGMS